MDSKDYYVVLGVARGESPQGIRKAFRDLVREHHPDRAGPEGTPLFREVVEAYRVLSDPDLRRAHDARLRARDAPRPAAPRQGRRPRAFASPHGFGPSAEALLDRILRNFGAAGLAKGERPEPLLCDVLLSPAEARCGGVMPIRLPTLSPCPACHGAGHQAGFRCGACDASGAVRAEAVVPVDLPAGVPSGWVLEAPLSRWGLGNRWLRVRVRVAP